MKVESRIGLAVAAALCLVGSAHAATVNRVVLKASDTTAQSGTTVVDPYEDWAATVGVNEGVTGADAIANNGIDFKDSWVDSNWGLVDSVRVSMHADVQGQLSEVAYFEFDAAGTTKTDFFAPGNLTGSTWGSTGFPTTGQSGNPFATGEWFSAEGSWGDYGDRHWYVNNNWGGCAVDRGWFMVLDRDGAPNDFICSWERDAAQATGTSDRGFMYSTASGMQQFNGGGYGVASVFSISVSYDDSVSAVPVPASMGLLGSAFGLLGLRRRGKHS